MEMIIPIEYAGQRIDRVLSQLLPQWSRSKLCTWLKDGHIKIDDKVQKPNDKVWGGEHVLLNLPTEKDLSHRPENIPLDLLFEDDHILVINKPAGWVVHPGAGNPQGTLLNALLHHYPNLSALPRAGIVHRLDKDTSGVMVIAKTLEAYTALIRQMQAREIHRQYLALVYGHIIAGRTLSTGYGRDTKNRLKMAVRTNDTPAITEFKILKHYHYVSLLKVILHTGRTHQIRVHMAHIQHGIVGDPLYTSRSSLKAGMSETLRQTLRAFPRQALHAQVLSFQHPILHHELSFTAPIPDDLQSLLKTLEEDAA